MAFSPHTKKEIRLESIVYLFTRVYYTNVGGLLYNIFYEKESKIAGHNFGLFTAYGMRNNENRNRRHYHGWAIQYGGMLGLFKAFK